ncbi:MAG: GC-type dockerin domain-anchored protein [Planctomycetota bacterium]
MNRRQTGLASITFLVCGVSAASAQVAPVRSSLETEASIGLSVVNLTDTDSAFDDQGATTNPLGLLMSTASISTTDGVFVTDSTGSAVFADAGSGTFLASQGYDGDQFGDEPTAQSFTHSMASMFEYDFTLSGDGSVRFQGELENSGPSFIGFVVRVNVLSEFAAGSGFTGSNFEQLVTDDVGNGATAFDITVPLNAASGSYRIQLRLGHSGNSILETDPEMGSTTIDWTITGPAACPADTNGDGRLTPADFNAWVLAFNAQAPACDQNGDGGCDPSDFNAWILNFNAGC